MILSPDQLLDNVRFNKVLLDQSTRFQNYLPLRFLDRLPTVNADDNEIVATFTQRIFAADVIPDDQAAPVYGGGQLSMVTNVLPNIKIGQRLPQSQLSRLARLKRGGGNSSDETAFFDWETVTAAALLRGVREQQNALACAMMIGTYAYSRNGVNILADWGLPTNHKATPSILWTSTSATPVTDVLTIKTAVANADGTILDRMTLSTADFRNMVATTEFKNLLQGLVAAPIGASTGAFNTLSPRMYEFAALLLGMEVEIDDKTYFRQNTDGSQTSTRVLPLGKVILSSKSDDKNPATWDMGNAVVTESIVAELTGSPGAFPGEQYGPFSYYTGRADLNPPDLTAWAVARCFPRKHNVYAGAVLTVQ